ncbi:MAG: hypothetical protein J6S47_05170 [Eubacteriaceae bacterium]|nr:hypothetical protein [Eubacteriaceae bacterium]
MLKRISIVIACLIVLSAFSACAYNKSEDNSEPFSIIGSWEMYKELETSPEERDEADPFRDASKAYFCYSFSEDDTFTEIWYYTDEDGNAVYNPDYENHNEFSGSYELAEDNLTMYVVDPWTRAIDILVYKITPLDSDSFEMRITEMAGHSIINGDSHVYTRK